jgi:integrase/recombinase XerD
LYSSAIRREETAHLRLEDVDTEHGFLIVREGKNRKDRAVPTGASVCALLQTYIVGVRKDWLGADRDRHLFLNRFGRGMGPNAIWHVVHKYSRAANIDRAVSTHAPQLRNSYAASGCADSASAGDVGACLDRDHASLHAGDHH